MPPRHREGSRASRASTDRAAPLWVTCECHGLLRQLHLRGRRGRGQKLLVGPLCIQSRYGVVFEASLATHSVTASVARQYEDNRGHFFGVDQIVEHRRQERYPAEELRAVLHDHERRGRAGHVLRWNVNQYLACGGPRKDVPG